jgi:hypothetical protein
MLKINYSTAKTILRVFRLENRILKKASYKKHLQNVRMNSENRETTHTQNKTLSRENSLEIDEVPTFDAETVMKQIQFASSALQSCVHEVITNEIIIAKIRSILNMNCIVFN